MLRNQSNNFKKWIQRGSICISFIWRKHCRMVLLKISLKN